MLSNFDLFFLLFSSFSIIASAQNTYFQWVTGGATFYSMGGGGTNLAGACGYSGATNFGVGINNAAAASFLWKKGKGCGGCFEVKCDVTKNRKEYCYPGKSVTVTITNMCPRGGVGWCNPPRKHLDMSIPAFEKIAITRAGYINTLMRRVPCARKGNINFRMGGNPWFLTMTIFNVAGFGEIQTVYIQVNKPGRTWYLLRQNWGVMYSRSHNFQPQPLNVKLILMNGQSLIIKNAIPQGWRTGATYSGGQFSGASSGGRKFARRNLRASTNSGESSLNFDSPTGMRHKRQKKMPLVSHARFDYTHKAASLRKVQVQLGEKVEEARKVLGESRTVSETLKAVQAEISSAEALMEELEFMREKNEEIVPVQTNEISKP